MRDRYREEMSRERAWVGRSTPSRGAPVRCRPKNFTETARRGSTAANPVSLLIAEPERIQCCLQPPACAKSASENVASHTALFSRDIAREVER